MRKEDVSLRDYIKEESLQKTFARVFDRQTIMSVHYLATKGLFDLLEFPISSGKEAIVFRARDKAGNYRAVKIYKISTSNFRQMDKYLLGDERFKNVRREKRDIVYAWARKEYRNLEIATKAKVRVPLPLGFKNNVLVMEFIGENGEAAKTLKEVGYSDTKKAYETLTDYIIRLYYADLVHSDLSEYNILVKGSSSQLVLIDMGQAVLRSHPKAREFFERDIRNLGKYFSKMGLKKSYEEIYEDIRAKKRLF